MQLIKLQKIKIMKTCSRCNLDKEFTEFIERKSAKDGFRNQCKKCLAIIAKEWKLNNKEKVLQNRKKDYAKNSERYKRKAKEWVKDNKERKIKTDKDYYKKNELSIKEWRKQYQIDNKDKVLEYRKVYYETNKNIICKKTREYYSKNKVKIKIYSKEYAKKRKKTDKFHISKDNLKKE